MAERALATAFVNIVPGTKDFDTKLKQQLTGKMSGVGDEAGGKFNKGFGGAVSKIGGFLSAALATGAVVGFTKSLIDAANAEVVGNKRLENIASSMGIFGKHAGDVAKRLEDVATQQQLTNGLDDDTIKLTQAKLLTFKDLAVTATKAGGAFDRATQAAIDMSAAGFGDAANNAVQLGKALNDPVKGINALTRSGITFTAEEKKRIETLVKSNKMGEAQNIVLKAIETQVGGTAAATATASDRMKQGWENLKETVGLALLPAFDKLATFMSNTVLPAMTTGAEKLGPIFAAVGERLMPIFTALGDVFSRMFGYLEPLIPSVIALWGAFNPLGILIDSLLPFLGTLVDGIMPGLVAIINQVLPALSTLLGVFSTVGTALIQAVLPPLLSLVQVFLGALMPVLAQVVPLVVDLAKTVGGILVSYIKQAAPVLALFVGAIAEILKQVLPVIGQLIALALQAVMPLIKAIQPLIGAILPVLATWFKFLVPIITTLVSVLIAILVPVIKVVVTVLGAVIGAVAAVITWFSSMVTGLNKAAAGILSFFGSLPGTIQKALAGAGTWLVDTGKNLIQGLLNGAGSLLKNIGNFFLNMLPDWIKGPFKTALGIHSPSKVFIDFGQNIMQGLVKGLTGDKDSVVSTMQKVGNWVTDALQSKKITAKAAQTARAYVKAYTAELSKLATEHEKVMADLEKAQDTLTAKLQEKADLVTSLQSKYAPQYDFNVEGGLTAQLAIENLTKQVAKTKELKSVTDQLQKMGLNKDLYKQIVEAGAVDFAKSIIEGGQGAVDQLNVLADQASAQATALAEQVGSVLYDQGIKFAQSVVDGLAARKTELESLMKAVAEAFGKEISRIVEEGNKAAEAAAKKAKDAAAIANNAASAANGAAAAAKAAASAASAAKAAATYVADKMATAATAAKTTAVTASGKILALASGGLVNQPTTALVGEAGPEVVTPLKDFERMMGVGQAAPSITYVAAPNQSLDAEQALFQAIKRAKVVGAW